MILLTRTFLILFSFLISSHIYADTPTKEVFVDRIAAVVGDELILASEVEFEARLALVKQGGEAGLSATIDDPLRARILDELIVVELSFAEAKRLRLLDNKEQEEERRKKAFLRLSLEVGPWLDAVLDRFDIDQNFLDSYLRKRIYTTQLLEKRLGTTPSKNEVEQFYQKHAKLFTGYTLDEVYDQVALLAQKQMMQERLVRYLEELQGRFSVRILLPAAKKR